MKLVRGGGVMRNRPMMRASATIHERHESNRNTSTTLTHAHTPWGEWGRVGESGGEWGIVGKKGRESEG